LAISVILATLVATFLIFFVGPSDPAAAMCPESHCPPERLASIRANLGLDKPITEQFLEYFKGLFVGREFHVGGDAIHCGAPCLGVSFSSGRSVNDELFSRFPNTVMLALGAVVIFLVVGLAIGIVAAMRRGTSVDRGLIGASQVLGAIPYYIIALLFALYVTILNPILPQPAAASEGYGRYVAGFIAPWIVLGVVTATGYVRYTRNSMIETLSMDFVRTARSKGISERRVVGGHALRAALSPIVTILGLDIAALLSGTLITERIFSVDGIGRRTLRALGDDDLPVIMGEVLIGAVLVVTMNLIVDIAYSYIDPRVRLS
jgi:peptide/nickel transport system permease protein